MKKGFFLVEMAIVLIIFSLILGVGAISIDKLVKFNKFRETKKLLNSLAEAIEGYGITYGYLPDKKKFLESFKLKDPYGQEVFYVYSQALTQNYLKKFSADLCDIKSTGLNLYDEREKKIINNVAFLIFSRGEDYTTNTFCNGEKVTESRQCSGKITVDTEKDVVAFVTLEELKAKRDCGEPIKIFPYVLPLGFVNEDYRAEIKVSGGKPLTGGEYYWCYEIAPKPKDFSISPDSKCPKYVKSRSLVIEGIPKSAETYTLKVCVKDGNVPPYLKCKKYSLEVYGNGTQETGTQSCDSYTLVLSAEPYHGKCRVNDFSFTINGKCEKKRIIHRCLSIKKENLKPTDVLIVYNTWICPLGKPILHGSMRDLDENNDCYVFLKCSHGKCSRDSQIPESECKSYKVRLKVINRNWWGNGYSLWIGNKEVVSWMYEGERNFSNVDPLSEIILFEGSSWSGRVVTSGLPEELDKNGDCSIYFLCKFGKCLVDPNVNAVCKKYTLKLRVENGEEWWKNPISVRISPKVYCNVRTGGSLTKSGLDPDDYLLIFRGWWCSRSYPTLLEGNVSKFDTNGDCIVEVTCKNGNCAYQ